MESKTRQNRKVYSKEYKIQALNLVRELGSHTKASQHLGVPDSLLDTWKRKFNFSIDLNSKDAATAVAETEEIKRLRKENEELKKTNYILKRAAASF